MLRRAGEGLLLVILGAQLGILGAFLVPVRLFGHLEGVAVLVAVVGNVVAGLLAAEVFGEPAAALLPGAGWLACAILASVRLPSGSLLITTGSVPGDPGLGRTGVLFLFAGIAAAAGAVPIARRRAR